MKSAYVLVVVMTMLIPGHIRAQGRDDREAFFTPELRSIWIEGLVVGTPCAGLGFDFDASRAYEDSDSSASYGLGVRGWFGMGYSVSPLSSRFGKDWYEDFDVLLRGSLVVENFSAALLTGYSYRIWDGESGLPSGHRLKIGVELNYPIVGGRIVLRARAMGVALASNGEFEYGPVALGAAIGWFRLK